MLLVLAFGRARDALLILLNLPLALIGGVAGVFLAGGVLSVASMIGFITLCGIATRNGIMLVSHIRHLVQEEGVTDVREAVECGARAWRSCRWRSAAARPARNSDANGHRHPFGAHDV